MKDYTMHINLHVIAISFLSLIGARAMALDVFTLAIKEVNFDANGLADAREIAIDWNNVTLIAGKHYTTKAVAYHQGSTGGVDLVRIVLDSDVGELTTTQSLFTHMVSCPYNGAAGDTDRAAAIQALATATLPSVTGAFAFDREEDGVKRFRCAAPNEKLIGLYFNGTVAIAQIKATQSADNSEGDKVDVNKNWFSSIGVDKTGNP